MHLGTLKELKETGEDRRRYFRTRNGREPGDMYLRGEKPEGILNLEMPWGVHKRSLRPGNMMWRSEGVKGSGNLKMNRSERVPGGSGRSWRGGEEGRS